VRGRLIAVLGKRPAVLDLFFLLVLLAAGLSLTACGVTSKGAAADDPTISVTPSSASFGNVTVKTDATQTVKLSNTGTADLKISQAKLTGSGFTMSGLVAPVTVAAGSSMNFTIAFKPTATGADSGSISIASNDSGSPLTINMTGTGVASTLKLSASVADVSFGSVAVGTTATQEVKLTNTGNATVEISSASAFGTGFHSSGGSNVNLTPNQSVNVTVTFDPQTAGGLSGTLSVSSNAAALKIPLSGTGTQAAQQHSVSLTWSPSTSDVIGYFVYRRTGSSGSFAKVKSTIDASTAFTDSSVANGQIYFYVVTSVASSDVESAFSTQVEVTIPSS
jgi:hypothetical protein